MKKRLFRKHQTVVVFQILTEPADIPKRCLGRKAIVLNNAGEENGIFLYEIKVSNRKKPFLVFEDECRKPKRY